jgi:hypothetical protein
MVMKNLIGILSFAKNYLIEISEIINKNIRKEKKRNKFY